MRNPCVRYLLFLLVGLAAAPALAAADVTELELMQAATDLGRQYDTNYNDKNAAALATLYALDGVFVTPSGSIVRGRDALKAYYASRFAAGTRGHAIKVVEVHVQGDGGYGLAHFSVNVPGTNGELHEVGGNLIAVYQRSPDGWHMRLVEASVTKPAGK